MNSEKPSLVNYFQNGSPSGSSDASLPTVPGSEAPAGATAPEAPSENVEASPETEGESAVDAAPSPTGEADAASAGIESETEPKPQPKKASAKAKEWQDLHRKNRYYQTKDAEYKRKDEELNQLRNVFNGLKTNPLKTLQTLGVGYEQVTNEYVSQYDKDPNYNPQLEQANHKIAQLETHVKQLINHLQQQQEHSVIQKFNTEVKSILSDTSKYEFLNSYDADDAIQVIAERFVASDQAGDPKTVLEIAQEIEQELEEYYSQKLKLNKLKTKINVNKPKEKVPDSNTLNNSMNSRQTTYTQNKGKRPSLVDYLTNDTKGRN